MSAVIIRLDDYRPSPKPQPEPIWLTPCDFWAAAFRVQGLALLLWAQSMEGRR